MVKVIRDFDEEKVTITLNEEDFETFRRALLSDPNPGKGLRELLLKPITYIEVGDNEEDVYFNEHLNNLNKYGEW